MRVHSINVIVEGFCALRLHCATFATSKCSLGSPNIRLFSADLTPHSTVALLLLSHTSACLILSLSNCHPLEIAHDKCIKPAPRRTEFLFRSEYCTRTVKSWLHWVNRICRVMGKLEGKTFNVLWLGLNNLRTHTLASSVSNVWLAFTVLILSHRSSFTRFFHNYFPS